jgi:hypothetical protein
MERIAFSTACRAATEAVLRGYATQAVLAVSTYRARPTSLHLPHAFIDRLRETVTYVGPTNMQRRVLIDVIIVHGLFDAGDAVDQRDRLVDGFLGYLAEHFDAAGANTILSGASVTDIPVYRPDWFPEDRQETYFATLVTLEGYAET